MLSVVNLLANKLFIVGADECGWGAVAGPLVVCGVKAPKDWSIPGLNDSKKFKVAENREAMCYKLFKLIDNGIITCHIAERTNDIIDKNGPYPTLKDCYVEIFHTLYCKDSLIIADGNMKFDGLGVDHYDKVSEPKADGKYPAVMAASIIGKTYRDHLMTILHDKIRYMIGKRIKAIQDQNIWR